MTIWTRNLDTGELVGRLQIVRAIRQALGRAAPIHSVTLDLVERGSTVAGWLRIAMKLGASLVTLRPIPLQCALFGAFGEAGIVAALPKSAGSVYLDGIRTLLLLRALRRQRPQLHIVCDLDDLMSRRMAFWQSVRAGVSIGYLSRLLPARVSRLLSQGPLARAIVAYERAALLRAEREVVRLSDAVVLLSSADAAELVRRLPVGEHAKVRVIPPSGTRRRPAQILRRPLRFVFVGTDALLQNRLTIAYLLDIWSRLQPYTELHIFGHQRRMPSHLPENVVLRGFVEDFAEIYDAHSVLLTPSIIGGGIKTKVIEAFGFGVPVIGNAYTFEGLAIDGYPLNIDSEQDLLAIIADPDAAIEHINAAAAIGNGFLDEKLSAATFSRNWTTTVVGETAAT